MRGGEIEKETFMKKKCKGFLILLTLAFALAGCIGLAACDENAADDGGANSGIEEDGAYQIAISETQHGSVATDRRTADEGELVTVTVSPDEGYGTDVIYVGEDEYSLKDNQVIFAMPAENVTVGCTFAELPATDAAPATYAFRLNAYLNRVMAKSIWTYTFGDSALELSVWAEDREVNEDVDSVKMYFGTSESAYAVGRSNVALEAFRNGTVNTYRGENGAYAQSTVDGLDVTVKPWAPEGEVIGYKVTASLAYSVLGIGSEADAIGGITLYPMFVNGNMTSPVSITKTVTDAGTVSRPNTYPVLSANNGYVKNEFYSESATFGSAGGIEQGESWDLGGDTDSAAPDRIAVLDNTDKKDNNLIFRDTVGGEIMYAEATFRLTGVYASERWGKFGFMLFDGAAYNGLFCYVDAYIGNDVAVSVDNVAGTSLGYNRARNGWGSWTTISGTNGAFDLQDKTITLKIAYTGSQVYLYSGDTLVLSYAYNATNDSRAVLGIRSFNYGLEVTDYYATTDPTDAKYLAHVPQAIDFTDAFELSGGVAGEIAADMTVTQQTRTFSALEGQSGALYVKNEDLNEASAYVVLVNGEVIDTASTVWTGVGESSLKYEFALAAGENTVTIAYITKPSDMLFKLVVVSGGTESDISAADSWTESTASVTAEEKPVYYFLGSSVTYGATNNGVSFVEKVAAALGVEYEKEAVSGTTLAQTNSSSYVDRLKNFPTDQAPEVLFVQLSTNDATNNVPMGSVSDSTDMEDFDVSTTIGAIEYIIAYARETWGADVVFYTNPKFNNANYEQLVAALYNVQEKWGIEIIDFYFYRDMDAVGDSALSSMMSDSIHPNDDGYEWMAEIIGARLRKLFEEKALAAYFAE